MITNLKALSKIISLLLVLLSCLSKPLVSQEAEFDNIFREEKVSLMMGIGLDYGLVGFRMKYRLHPNLRAVTNLGVSTESALINLGIEANLYPGFTKKISPYISACYGVIGNVDLYSSEGINELKLLIAPSLGLGLHFNLFKNGKTYLSVGINYSLIEPQVDNHYEEFIQSYGWGAYSRSRNVLPSLGMAMRVWK